MLVALLRRDAEGSGADPATFKDVSIPDASDDDAADKHPRAALPDVVISRTCVLSARAWFSSPRGQLRAEDSEEKAHYINSPDERALKRKSKDKGVDAEQDFNRSVV
jgi:hypothetical protein